MEVRVDDVLVYRGVLKRAPEQKSDRDGTLGPAQEDEAGRTCQAQTVLFTRDPVECAGELVYSPAELAEDAAVVFIDEGTQRGRGERLVRPYTSARQRGPALFPS